MLKASLAKVKSVTNMDLLKRRIVIAFAFAAIYLVMILCFIGWREDHLVMILLVVGLLVAHKVTYKIVITLSAFAFFWISYDFLRIYPNYMLSPVHIFEPYNLELRLFGILDAGKLVVPCEWFITRTSDVLSIIAGASYLMWMPAPMSYALYLLVKKPDAVIDFTYGFLLTNLIGFVIYYSYPAAPPWYYINFGGGTDFTIPGSEGLLSEFDRLVGVPIFNGIYAKNANVFAAIPSLHSSYPVIGFLSAFRYRQKYWMYFFGILALGTWFAAVYSQHHYIIDVILGVLCAVIAFGVIKKLDHWKYYQKFRFWMNTQLSS